MLMPVTSDGCRSGVHWTRAKTESSILLAIARASTVLPVPGTSSNRTWPWQVSAARTSLISSRLPRSTHSVFATVGSGGTSKKSAQPLPASSCSPIVYKGSGSPKYLVASDLPLQGSGRSQTIEMTKAIQFILNGAGWKAGAYTLGYQSCDDA